MKHALRKYISPCGSALFMVVSTMAALIVLVTAMYMSVVSSRKVQYATFDQEQAYVTSTSISDMVYSYIVSGESPALTNAVSGLSVGESISTNGNNFKSFGGSIKDDEYILGAYDVSITYIYDSSEGSVYDIAVTVENNGVYETTHDFLIRTGEDPKMRRINNFFTSTGYLPTDIWLKKAAADSTMYFDNEFVKFTKHNLGVSVSEDMYYNFDITALGSVEFGIANNVPADCKPGRPLTWVIGNDMTIPYSNDTQNWSNLDFFGTPTNHGKLIVGGNLEIYGNNGRNIPAYTDIYVMGDLKIGFQNGDINSLGNIYVGGTIYDTSNMSDKMTSDTLKHMYSNGLGYIYKENEPIKLSSWDATEATALYNQKMNPSVWPKWKVSASANVKDFYFNNSNNYVEYIDSDCTIGKYKAEQTSNSRAIVIYTGNKETDVRTITLAPNYPNGDPVFSWNPWGGVNGTTMVLTVGKGSLVINVPDDVVYQDCSNELFGNIAWYTLLGGKVDEYNGKLVIGDAIYDENGNFKEIEYPNNVLNSVKAYMLNEYKEGYVYQAGDIKLKDGSTRCNGSLSTDPAVNKQLNIANGACEYIVKTAKINGEGDERKYYTCKTHGGWYDFDDKECTTCAEIDDYYAGECDSLCIGRINTKAFDDFYKTDKGKKAKEYLTKFYGKYSKTAGDDVADYLYPNVNIFLVSSSENAQINLGKSDYTSDNIQSAYFGYIYAPYMTFSVDGGAGDRNNTNWPMRSMGGLVVSDIIMGSGTGFLFAQPDVSIPGLVGKNWRDDVLNSYADKTWRHGGT